MKIEEVIDMVRGLNITEDEESLTFKAAIVLLYGMTNETVRLQNLKRATGYWWKEIYFLINNFRANLVIVDYHWEVPISEDDLQNLVEITCIAMAGAGKLVRVSPNAIMPKEKVFSWEEYNKHMEYCSNPSLASDFLYKRFGNSRKVPAKIKKKQVEELPIWLIEKQQKIKEQAAKFDENNV